MNRDTKILNQTLAKQFQQHIKRILHHEQLGFIPGLERWFNTQKSTNIIYYINKMKEKMNK